MSDIADVFSDESETVEVADTVETTEETTPEVTQEAAETPKEEAKEEPEKDEGETTTPDDKLPDWAKAQLKADRVKRQEAQSQLETMQKELDALKSPKQEESEPDIFDDPEGYKNSVSQNVQDQLANMRMEVSRRMLIKFTDDYEEVETKVIEAAKSDPMLASFLRSQVQNSDDPAEAFYEQGKKYLKLQEMQDVEGYEKQLKAKYRAEIEAEMKGKQQEAEESSVSISPSLTKARSVGGSESSLTQNPGDLF